MQAEVGQDDAESKSPAEDRNGSKLRSILRRLNMISEDIEASAVTSSDGLIKAAMLGDEIDPDRFGAMCATLLALSKRAAKETARGELKLLLIEGTQGTMLIVQIGDKGVLALAARPKSNLGMIFLEARKVAGEISLLL
jgi:predicted regulator of Ras-like GTPase activity (Roadblock/LC7/MglB family)